jgi:DNA-binding HxlR family transcriptional regulator
MISSMDGDERETCTRHLTAFCPTYHRAIELIGRRWTGAILRAMLSGEARLKELEAEGIVRRTVVPSTPVRIDYALTDKGLALNEVIVAVSDWAEHWLAPVDEPIAVGDR